MLGRTMDVMIEANEALQLQSLTDQDVRIDVIMGDIATADFERVPETFPLGEAAARKAAPQLARFAVSPEQYAAWRTRITSEQNIETRLAGVQFAGLTRVNPEFLSQRAELKPGDNVDIAAISREAQRLSALQEFEAVSYNLQGDPSNPTLEWLPKEKSWGPDFLKADVGIYAAAKSEASFLFYLQHTRTWVNSLGAQWRNELQIGTNQLLSTSFYQPLEVSQRFFFEPKLSVNREYQDIYADGERFARYTYGDFGGRIDFGMNLGQRSQLRLGYVATEHRVRVDTGTEVLPEGDPLDAGLAFSAIYDSRDTPFTPTRGLAAALEYQISDEGLGSDRDWEKAELGLGYTIPFARDVAYLNAAGGTDFGGGLPGDRLFVLGGPLSFPGYDPGELRAAAYWTVSGSYLWKLADLMTLRGQALYGGVRLQVGEVFDRFDEPFLDEETGTIGSASLYVTGRTPVGPITLGFAGTNTDSWTLWMSLGRPVGTGTILERGIFR
jgi:NTE family protein